MSTFKAFTKYQLALYLKSYKYVFPFSALLLFLQINYDSPVVSPITSFMVSMTALFFISVWAGFSYTDAEDIISQELMILCIKSEKKYYIYKALMLFAIGLLMSVICIMFPIFKNILTGFSLFKDGLFLADAARAFALHICFSYVGLSLGAFFHARIMENRSHAAAAALMLSILAIAKLNLNEYLPVSKYFTWLVPPIADFISLMRDYQFEKIWLIIFLSLIYGTVFQFLGIKLLIRNKF